MSDLSDRSVDSFPGKNVCLQTGSFLSCVIVTTLAFTVLFSQPFPDAPCYECSELREEVKALQFVLTYEHVEASMLQAECPEDGLQTGFVTNGDVDNDGTRDWDDFFVPLHGLSDEFKNAFGVSLAFAPPGPVSELEIYYGSFGGPIKYSKKPIIRMNGYPYLVFVWPEPVQLSYTVYDEGGLYSFTVDDDNCETVTYDGVNRDAVCEIY